MDRFLYEILVPTVHRTKLDKTGQPKPYRTRYHRVWDQKVRDITGGLTIMAPSKGQWISPDGSLFVERMIPVRIIATHEEIEKIIEMTLDYYDQEAVLAYRLSEEVLLRHRK